MTGLEKNEAYKIAKPEQSHNFVANEKVRKFT
jgi:hypothetical protein